MGTSHEELRKFIISRPVLLRIRNASVKIRRENHNIHFMFNNFLFRKPCRLWDKVKNKRLRMGLTPQVSRMSLCMYIAHTCYIFRQCHVPCAHNTRVWWKERIMEFLIMQYSLFVSSNQADKTGKARGTYAGEWKMHTEFPWGNSKEIIWNI